jgi:sigma-70-like protein
MNEQEWLAERFEANRAHLRAVAYRILGSLSEAEDAVQESWLRISRSDTHSVENLRGWLTTIVARAAQPRRPQGLTTLCYAGQVGRLAWIGARVCEASRAWERCGIGLGAAVAGIGVERDCGRLERGVVDWNEPSIQFYKNLGAEPLQDWTKPIDG